jgi:hypothetical protein
MWGKQQFWARSVAKYQKAKRHHSRKKSCWFNVKGRINRTQNIKFVMKTWTSRLDREYWKFFTEFQRNFVFNHLIWMLICLVTQSKNETSSQHRLKSKFYCVQIPFGAFSHCVWHLLFWGGTSVFRTPWTPP